MTVSSRPPEKVLPPGAAVLRCLCSQCAGHTLFTDPIAYLEHTRTGLVRPSTQLSLFPEVAPDVRWP